jgi:hypothetical protein
MSLIRTSVEVQPSSLFVHNNQIPGSTFYAEYKGVIVPNRHVRALGSSTKPTNASLQLNTSMIANGTKGWSMYKPTHTQASIGQAIGELREGIINPHNIRQLRDSFKNFRKFGKGVGSGHLAINFGLLPLIKDLQDLIKQVQKFDKNLHQLVRDNGKSVRRRGTVSKSETNSQSTSIGTGSNSFIIGADEVRLLSTTKAVQELETKSEITYWISGRWRYFLDRENHGYMDLDLRTQQQFGRILFGIDVTDPHLYYELMPWSWLIDWATPIGPMLDNFSNDSVDRLVADYAYIMAHSVSRETAKVTTRFVDNREVSTASTLLQETKQRSIATPYGFGVDMSGLSLKRLAILASLGLTKVV